MFQLKSVLPAMAVAGGISLAVSGTAPAARAQTASPAPMVTAPSGNVPQTGSAQGVNPHNSMPMPRGMVMPRAANNGPMVTSPSGNVPQTGAEQGVNSHNSEPMPRGMVMPRTANNGPMVTSPSGLVPQTGSAQGVESPGSMPPGHMAADPNKKP